MINTKNSTNFVTREAVKYPPILIARGRKTCKTFTPFNSITDITDTDSYQN